MSRQEEKDSNEKDGENWLRRLLPRLHKQKGRGDIIAGSVEKGARGVAIGKNIIQIGTIVIPTVPALVAALGLLGILGFISYRAFVPLPTPTPALGPTRMSGLFNVAVAEFGEEDSSGQVRPSPDGQQLSEWVFNGLRLEFESLPVNLRQEFQPLVWHDSLSPQEKGIKIGIIPGNTPEARQEAAAKLANAIGADMVIYGNLVSGGGTAGFVPEFYVAALRGEADEIVGRHQLGAPILVQLPLDLSDRQTERSLNKQLISRTKALSRFTIGLMYDLGGFSEDALQVFQQEVEQLGGDTNSGEEIFYHFIGRSALFLNQDEEAQAAFEKALATNPNYARPYIGLGSVYYKRAQCRSLDAATQNSDQAYAELCQRKDGGRIAPCQLSADECRGLVEQDLQQAVDNYQKAVELADATLEPQTKIMGHLGLGIAYRLEGATYFYIGNDEKAYPLFDKAIEEITATLDPMKAAEQHRNLGGAYLALGEAYAQQARIRQDTGDKAGSIILYQKAHQAYTGCIAQEAELPSDGILQKTVAAACKPYDKVASDAMAALQGAQ